MAATVSMPPFPSLHTCSSEPWRRDPRRGMQGGGVLEIDPDQAEYQLMLVLGQDKRTEGEDELVFDDWLDGGFLSGNNWKTVELPQTP